MKGQPRQLTFFAVKTERIEFTWKEITATLLCNNLSPAQKVIIRLSRLINLCD